MKKPMLNIAVIIGVVGIGLILFLLSMGVRIGYSPAHPTSVTIPLIEISDAFIDIRIHTPEFTSDGPADYKGYHMRYDEGILYLSIYLVHDFFPLSRKQKASYDQQGNIIISKPNSYGPIQAVYLEGSTPDENVMIWPENLRNMEHSQ